MDTKDDDFEFNVNEVQEVITKIAETIFDCNIDMEKCFLALALTFIEASHKFEISKPHLLTLVSQLWELRESEKKRGTKVGEKNEYRS